MCFIDVSGVSVHYKPHPLPKVSAIVYVKLGDALEIHDEIIFKFYPKLPHL